MAQWGTQSAEMKKSALTAQIEAIDHKKVKRHRSR